MSGVRWVVQLNLGKDEDNIKIKEACDALDQPCELLKVIPFSETLPHIDNDIPTVFYGGTNWINAIHKSKQWQPGAFFDEEKFQYSSAKQAYGEHFLNDTATVCTFQELFNHIEENDLIDEEMFVRPLRDMKEFHGQVVRAYEMSKFFNNISHGGYTITPNTMVVHSEPIGIACEWRLFMVGGRVSSGSQYRVYQKLDVKPEVPSDVIEFAERMAHLWSPADVFVMDVGRSGDNLYVIENNCFNSSGFYDTDIMKVVKDVSQFILGPTTKSEVYY